MDLQPLSELGPLGIGAVAVWLFARFVAAFTRLSDDIREYAREVRKGLREEREHRLQEQAYWASWREQFESPIKVGFVARD